MKNIVGKLSLVLFVCFVALMTVGVVAFPAAPIRPNGAMYVDKRGQPHTKEEYRRFRLWERSFIAVGGAVVLIVIGLAVHQHRKRGSPDIHPGFDR